MTDRIRFPYSDIDLIVEALTDAQERGRAHGVSEAQAAHVARNQIIIKLESFLSEMGVTQSAMLSR